MLALPDTRQAHAWPPSRARPVQRFVRRGRAKECDGQGRVRTAHGTTRLDGSRATISAATSAGGRMVSILGAGTET